MQTDSHAESDRERPKYAPSLGWKMNSKTEVSERKLSQGESWPRIMVGGCFYISLVFVLFVIGALVVLGIIYSVDHLIVGWR